MTSDHDPDRVSTTESVPAGDYYPQHQPNCLGCGEENACSLGVRMRAEGEHVVGNVTLDRRHEGAPGFAHGGALATALDDSLGFLMRHLRRPAVTAKLEVNYRKPAFLGEQFHLKAWLEKQDGRKLYTKAEMRDDDGMIIAEADALFVGVGLEHFLEGAKRLPEDVKRDLGKRRAELPW